jgi:cystathionine beta-lyase/cystathionine gamma-synthase
MELCDLRAICDLSHRHGVEVVVDNTFMSPYFQRPIEFGRRHGCPLHHEISQRPQRRFGRSGRLHQTRAGGKLAFLQKCAGAILSPFECFLILRGVKTLAVRMLQHDRNGRKVANYLSKHKKVQKVSIPDCPIIRSTNWRSARCRVLDR